MPKSAEKQVKRQGGAARYRTLKKDGKTMTCAVTRKEGPKGGRTVCWPKESAAAIASNLLEDDGTGMREKHKLVLGVTIEYPESLGTHEAIRAFLENLPEQIGPVVVHDARVIRGMLDQDSVPLATPEPSYDKVR